MRIRTLKEIRAYWPREREERPLAARVIPSGRSYPNATLEADGSVFVCCGFVPVHLLPGEWAEVKEQTVLFKG